MAFITFKAVVGLIAGVIITLILWYVWSSVFTLLPYSTTVDTQSYNSFNFLVNELNQIKLNGKKETSYFISKNYILKYLNKEDIDDKLKKKYPTCSLNSCVCLCQDLKCDNVQCTHINKKFEKSGEIKGEKGGILNLVHSNKGVSIEPK
jgi:hypothetical protein